MDVVERINSIQDECLHLLETLKQHQDVLLGVLHNSPAEEDLSDLHRTPQVYCEFRANITAMVDNLDVLDDHLIRKL